jgi:hypothetical protein
MQEEQTRNEIPEKGNQSLRQKEEPVKIQAAATAERIRKTCRTFSALSAKSMGTTQHQKHAQ